MKDINGYIEKLDKSMTKKEKLFFLNKVKLSSYDYIVDFGCANGRLLYEVDKHLKGKAKNLQLIGVEKNEDIKIDYEFAHKFTRVQQLCELPLQDMANKKVLLLLSSVIHELDIESLELICIFAEKFTNTIVIRDMDFKPTKISRLIEIPQFYLSFDKIANQLRTYDNDKFSYIFNRVWKKTKELNVSLESINFYVLYEFFMKYTYSDNWESEKDEEYPVNAALKTFVDYLECSNLFRLKYHKRYILPYKKKEVYKQFSYKMHCNTHIKLILERKRIKKFKLWYMT